MARSRYTFGTGWGAEEEVRKLKAADRDAAQVRKEVHGPSYQMVPSDQVQKGDPQRHPHGVPPEYDRPSMVDIIAGAPRALPISQRIQHGSDESRVEAFQQDLDEALGQVYDLAVFHREVGLGSDVGLRPWVYRERRGETRPARVSGWQREIDPARFLSY
jgi:hypothetical protein